MNSRKEAHSNLVLCVTLRNDVNHHGALERLLARGTLARCPYDLEADLCRRFGVSSQEGGLPSAALAWLGEGCKPAGRYWLRADPVHFALLRDSFALTRIDDLSQETADALVGVLQTHFASEGLYIHAPHPLRWYLTCTMQPQLHTRSPELVFGRDVRGWLPEGADAGIWHRYLNEIQMLLHDHPANIARESRGALPVNSVWLHGGGVLPEVAPRPTWHIWSTLPLPRGLAQASGAACHDAPVDAPTWRAQRSNGGQHLVVLEAMDAGQLERDWAAPLLNMLHMGELDRLELVLALPDGTLHCAVRRSDLWKFWRRPRPLQDLAVRL